MRQPHISREPTNEIIKTKLYRQPTLSGGLSARRRSHISSCDLENLFFVILRIDGRIFLMRFAILSTFLFSLIY